MKRTTTNRKRAGFTLVEVMLACFILTIVSMGAMAYSVQSARIIHLQGDARAALLRAEQRMELIKADPVTSSYWKDLTKAGQFRYLYDYNPSNSTPFSARTDDPNETIPVNTTNRPIWSTITRVKASTPTPKTAEAACIKIAVTVRYGTTTNQQVYLESYRTVYE